MVISKYELYAKKTESFVFDGALPLTKPDNVYKFVVDCLNMEERDREVFTVIAVDSKGSCTGVHDCSVGDLSHSIVHPREVFKFLLNCNAYGFLVVHNHPSGDITPSPDDIQTTKRLQECAKIMGVQLLDHLVVGGGRYESLRKMGVIE